MIADPRLKLIARDLQTIPAIVTACAALMKDIPDLEAVAEFLDVPPGIVQQIAHELKVRKILKKSAAAARERATQLPKTGWRLSDQMVAYARSWSFSDNEISKMSVRFRDHHLKNGSAMVDWEATWRTWVRNDAERSNKSRKVDEGQDLFVRSASNQPDPIWKQAMESWLRSRTWIPALGPAPDEPGCKVPADVLAQFHV